jgi:hypothetical protein
VRALEDERKQAATLAALRTERTSVIAQRLRIETGQRTGDPVADRTYGTVPRSNGWLGLGVQDAKALGNSYQVRCYNLGERCW